MKLSTNIDFMPIAGVIAYLNSNRYRLNLKCNENVEFYMVGIRKATKKKGITACFACRSENCDLEYIWSKVTNILKLFKYKCVVTEVNRITPELYCKIFEVDIASAVYAIQKYEKTEITDKLKKFFSYADSIVKHFAITLLRKD